jgi:hypothetical protein
MATFPPESWECRFIQDFDAYTPAPPTSGRLHLTALMAIRPAEGLEGHYKFMLTGVEHLQVKIPIARILSLPVLENLVLEGQFLPGHQVHLTLYYKYYTHSSMTHYRNNKFFF